MDQSVSPGAPGGPILADTDVNRPAWGSETSPWYGCFIPIDARSVPAPLGASFRRYNFGTPAEGRNDVFSGAKGVGVMVGQADLSRLNTFGKARGFNLVGTQLFHR